jgi:hypothetical protein
MPEMLRSFFSVCVLKTKQQKPLNTHWNFCSLQKMNCRNFLLIWSQQLMNYITRTNTTSNVHAVGKFNEINSVRVFITYYKFHLPTSIGLSSWKTETNLRVACLPWHFSLIRKITLREDSTVILLMTTRILKVRHRADTFFISCFRKFVCNDSPSKQLSIARLNNPNLLLRWLYSPMPTFATLIDFSQSSLYNRSDCSEATC